MQAGMHISISLIELWISGFEQAQEVQNQLRMNSKPGLLPDPLLSTRSKQLGRYSSRQPPQTHIVLCQQIVISGLSVQRMIVACLPTSTLLDVNHQFLMKIYILSIGFPLICTCIPRMNRRVSLIRKNRLTDISKQSLFNGIKFPLLQLL